MDCGAVYLGNEGGASVHLRKNSCAAAAYSAGYDSYPVPADTSAYTVPAGTYIRVLDLYRAFVQIKNLMQLKKSGEKFDAEKLKENSCIYNVSCAYRTFFHGCIFR